jgi:hypothetical protein
LHHWKRWTHCGTGFLISKGFHLVGDPCTKWMNQYSIWGGSSREDKKEATKKYDNSIGPNNQYKILLGDISLNNTLFTDRWNPVTDVPDS